MKNLIKLFALAGVMAMAPGLVSCGDDEEEIQVTSHTISKAELEAAPSWLRGASTYIWFRDGKMTYYKYAGSASSSTVENYTYTINGYDITLTRQYSYSKTGDTYRGRIVKESSQNITLTSYDNGKVVGNLPSHLVGVYSYSSVKID